MALKGAYEHCEHFSLHELYVAWRFLTYQTVDPS